MAGMGGIPKGLTHRRRQLVGQLWLRGHSVRDIAEMICNEAKKPGSLLQRCDRTRPHTVHDDIQACKRDWLARLGDKLDGHRADQVARLMDTIHQAWVDLANCKKATLIRHPDGTTEIENDTWHLRATYMRVTLDAEKELAKILGTLAPVRVAGPDGEPILPPIVNMHFPDGAVLQAPQNGHDPVEVTAGDNGDKPD